MRNKSPLKPLFVVLVFLALACNLTTGSQPTPEPTAVIEEAVAPSEPPPAEVEPSVETPEPAGETPPATTTEEVNAPILQVLGIANRDAAKSGRSPALAFGTAALDEPPSAWLAWAEDFASGSRQVFVSRWNGQAFEPAGASVNNHINVQADLPGLAFTGESTLVPWLAWIEPSPGFENVSNTFASRFNSISGLWIPAGQDRSAGEPSLNSRTNRNASALSIAGGSGNPAEPTVPWVTWEELGRLSNFTQLFVAKAVKDDAGIGGFIWEIVGAVTHNEEQSLNVDPFRHARNPSIVFAETGNAVPWVTWREEGGNRPSRIFTARGVADSSIQGGFRWLTTPACEPDEAACALNVNPLKDAGETTMAAGSVIPGEASVPWIAWTEVGPTGKFQVFVSRLDQVGRASFLQVGGSLNVDQNQDARSPVIVFLGNVPYVLWMETNSSGSDRIYIRHLASDPQTGTWVLDTPEGGFDHDPGRQNRSLAAASGLNRIFFAWVEGNPEAEVSSVVLAEFQP